MKAVIDTDVIAYLLLGTQPFAAAKACFMRTTRRAPAYWEADLANGLSQSVRAGVLPAGEPAVPIATLAAAAAGGRRLGAVDGNRNIRA